MLILFDHGTPRGLARALPGHTVTEARAFDLLLATDQGIRYQQNLTAETGRKIAIVVLCGSTKWSRVRQHLARIAAVVNTARPSSYTEVEIPFR
jgi:hypothetical protein